MRNNRSVHTEIWMGEKHKHTHILFPFTYSVRGVAHKNSTNELTMVKSDCGISVLYYYNKVHVLLYSYAYVCVAFLLRQQFSCSFSVINNYAALCSEFMSLLSIVVLFSSANNVWRHLQTFYVTVGDDFRYSHLRFNDWNRGQPVLSSHKIVIKRDCLTKVVCLIKVINKITNGVKWDFVNGFLISDPFLMEDTLARNNEMVEIRFYHLHFNTLFCWLFNRGDR